MNDHLSCTFSKPFSLTHSKNARQSSVVSDLGVWGVAFGLTANHNSSRNMAADEGVAEYSFALYPEPQEWVCRTQRSGYVPCPRRGMEVGPRFRLPGVTPFIYKMDLKRFVGGAPETLVDGVVMALFRAGVREASQNWLLNRLIARNMFRTAGHLLRKLARRWEGSLASLCFGLQVSSEQNERSEFATFTTPQLRWLRDEHGLDVVGTYLLEAAGVTAVSMDFVNDLFNYSKMHVGYASWTDPDLLANLMPLVHSVYSPAPTILQLRQVVTTPWHGSRILDVLKASPLASSVPSVACILADPHTDADKEEDLTAHPHLPKFEPLEELAVYRGGGTHLDRVVMHAPEALVYGPCSVPGFAKHATRGC